MINQPDSDKPKPLEDKTRNINIFVILSGIALCIWLVPGIGIISQIFINTRNPNLPNHKSNLTYEQVTQIVDKKTQETYSLINILLFVLTALPIAGNYYFWLLYKSVRNGLIEDSTHGLDEKINANVEKELDEKIPHYIKEDKLREEIATILQDRPHILEYSILQSQKISNMLKDDIINIHNAIANLQTQILDKIHPDNNAVNDNISKIQDSIKSIEQSMDLLKKENYYFNLGMENYYQGNYLEAIEEYDKAIEEDQKYDLAWYYKGEAYRQLGNDSAAQKDNDEASKYYSLAINAYTEVTKNSQLHRAFFYKAICHASIEQKHLVFESLREAIKLHPKYKQKSLEYRYFSSIIESDNLYDKACFYAVLDDKIQALDCLEEALQKIEDQVEKAQIKEQVKKLTYFDHIKNSEEYKERFQKLIEEE